MHVNVLERDLGPDQSPLSDQPPGQSGTDTDIAHAVVIIGGGPSGIRLAQELSKLDIDCVVFNAERWSPYNRVKLTPLLSGEVQIGQVTQSLEFQGPGNVALYSNTTVIDIDRDAKTVSTSAGRVWPYSKLVFCTGSRAHIPSIAGAELDGIFKFRDFNDVEKLVARSMRSRKGVVIGGGLLGLEAARGMHRRGVEMTVIEHEAHLMARQLDLRAGELLADHINGIGIKSVTGKSVKAFEGDERLNVTRLSDGTEIECDTAILCTGVRPNMEFARDIGLKVHRGIVVDHSLQTSDADIYAVGECAEVNDTVYGLVGPCYEQAIIAARHIADEAKAKPFYQGSTPATKLKIVGIDVFSVGDVDQIEQREDLRSVIFSDGEKHVYRRLVIRRGRLIGTLAIGDWSELGRIQEAVKAETRLFLWQERRFLKTGKIWPTTPPKSARDWPRAQTVCNCTGVTRGQIGDAISVGALTLADIKRDTGASTVCGTCKVHIGEILETPIEREAVAAWRTLAGISVFAAIAAIVTFFMPIWPAAKNIESWGIADMLFLDTIAKQWSGYILLALSSLAAILSLRKRISLFNRLGNYASWRLIHIIFGAITLVALFAHTGFRLGSNLNSWLMLCFLGLALAGSLAGLATAFEHRIGTGPQMAAALRSSSFWLHLIAFWPLPLLLAIHILTVYYY